MTCPLMERGLIDVVDVDEHDLEIFDITYLRPFSIDFSRKIRYKTCTMRAFDPLVGLGITETIPNRLLLPTSMGIT